MRRVPDLAINECVRELRAACRLPIEPAALEELVGWLRPNFERILGSHEGSKRWGDHGQRMRDNARHLGAFADFFGSHTGSDTIGAEELKRAFHLVRADCTVRAERTPVAWEYCRENGPAPSARASESGDLRQAEEFLRSMVPVPEHV